MKQYKESKNEAVVYADLVKNFTPFYDAYSEVAGSNDGGLLLMTFEKLQNYYKKPSLYLTRANS